MTMEEVALVTIKLKGDSKGTIFIWGKDKNVSDIKEGLGCIRKQLYLSSQDWRKERILFFKRGVRRRIAKEERELKETVQIFEKIYGFLLTIIKGAV